jgi:hypothetical protein
MKIIQIVNTYGRNCGIALFAGNLQKQIEKIGIELKTISTTDCNMSIADIILLHHHVELLKNESVKFLCERSQCPVVIFAHSDAIDITIDRIAGFVAMCPGMIPETDKPVHIFPHPAWVPECLEDRTILQNQFGLPIKPMIIGTNGFLKFERQFIEVLNVLLPHAKDNNWFVNVITSPWYIDSPGLIHELEKLQFAYSGFFRFENVFLDEKTLNQKLQACDLLWCWNRAASTPYASGVISGQYASGTRIFAADKLQHSHVLDLPNVVRGPEKLEPFIEKLVVEIKHGNCQRHDPSPVSWNGCIDGLAFFLEKIHSESHEAVN